MKNQPFSPGDCISALADDALSGSARIQAVQSVLSTSEGMQTWHTYHVIGDVLRSAELAPQGDDAAFWGRLSQTIAQETQRIQPPTADDGLGTRNMPAGRATTDSANGRVWHWQWVAGLAVVGFGGMLGMGLWSLGDASPRLATTDARQPELAVVPGSNGPMLRDPHLDSLMAAHQQIAGHSAMPAPAGFLRNATYEGASR